MLATGGGGVQLSGPILWPYAAATTTPGGTGPWPRSSTTPSPPPRHATLAAGADPGSTAMVPPLGGDPRPLPRPEPARQLPLLAELVTTGERDAHGMGRWFGYAANQGGSSSLRGSADLFSLLSSLLCIL
jgi:hypothetical protein